MTLPLWAGTFAVFAVLMVADLALTRKTVGFRAAATSSALWIAAALAFGGALWLWRGPATADQYFAGYLAAIAMVVGGAVAASLWRDRSRPREPPGQRPEPGQDREPERHRPVRT